MSSNNFKLQRPPAGGSGPIMLSLEEKQLFGQLWKQAAKDNSGSLSGQDAVPFFSKSGLPSDILSEIWQIADVDGKGSLDPQEFSIALRLIGHAQNNKMPNRQLIHVDGPLPVLDGINLEARSSNRDSTLSVSPEERAKYTDMFTKTSPVNGLLDGEKAREIFMKSKLPLDVLAQIWNLADVRKAGNLNQTEFIIAMHFIYRILDGTIKNLPPQLPKTLYSSAQGTPSSPTVAASPNFPRGISSSPQPVVRHMTGTPPAVVNRHFTGSNTGLQRHMTGGGHPVSTGGYTGKFEQMEWDVTPEERQKYSKIFENLDNMKQGYINGNDAVQFFISSKLPESDLFRIWNLSDINKSGRLSQEEFAVAMHLIHKKLTGSELPESLPESLVPPSLRQTGPRSSILGRSVSARYNRSMSGSSALDFFSNEMAPQSTGRNTDSLIDDTPLIGDFDVKPKTSTMDTFDFPNPAASVDLSKNFPSSFGSFDSQKHDLSQRLSQVQSLHDSERKLVQGMSEALSSEQQQLLQLRQELAESERKLMQARQEKSTLQGNLDRVRQEIEQLKQQIRMVNEETSQLREQAEKLKKDEDRQVKMLNITRGQLASSEAKREEVRRALDPSTASSPPKSSEPSSFLTWANSFGSSPSAPATQATGNTNADSFQSAAAAKAVSPQSTGGTSGLQSPPAAVAGNISPPSAGSSPFPTTSSTPTSITARPRAESAGGKPSSVSIDKLSGSFGQIALNQSPGGALVNKGAQTGGGASNPQLAPSQRPNEDQQDSNSKKSENNKSDPFAEFGKGFIVGKGVPAKSNDAKPGPRLDLDFNSKFPDINADLPSPTKFAEQFPELPSVDEIDKTAAQVKDTKNSVTSTATTPATGANNTQPAVADTPGKAQTDSSNTATVGEQKSNPAIAKTDQASEMAETPNNSTTSPESFFSSAFPAPSALSSASSNTFPAGTHPSIPSAMTNQQKPFSTVDSEPFDFEKSFRRASKIDTFDAMFQDLPLAKTSTSISDFEAAFEEPNMDVAFRPNFESSHSRGGSNSGFGDFVANKPKSDFDAMFGSPAQVGPIPPKTTQQNVMAGGFKSSTFSDFDDAFSTPAATAATTPAPPKPEIQGVQELMSMGFSRAQAINALERNDYNLERASNFLLDN
ncbi:uncharacterized protein VTP21DRAFT_10843 [Calcarisporiella thermophila]|uniref:uncharacterized protein n=1 Tax=Calcarisporiella thermophila TaxID=911321 RepID=UPI003744259D